MLFVNKTQKLVKHFLLTIFLLSIAGCGFHLQGSMSLPDEMHHVYLRARDPYGNLARELRQYLRMSNVTLADSPEKATCTLDIMNEEINKTLLSVSGTQQTRQYELGITITYQVLNPQGKVLLPPETLSESRVITIQSSQILGSSNEVNVYYQIIRRYLSFSIMSRLGSQEVRQTLKFNRLKK